MGNRLTLPLLLFAALLAGGAFFWLTGDEGRGNAAGPAGGEGAPVVADRPASELATPAVAQSGATQEPARTEIAGPQSPSPSVRGAAKGSGVALGGLVVDRFGAPVAGARVVLMANAGFPLDLETEREFPWLQRKRTTTDAEGRFRFEEVTPGTQQLGVRAAGFAPLERRGVAVPAADSELDPLVMARGAILSGTVVDPDGRGVAGAKIVPARLEEGALSFFPGARAPAAESGPDGRFRIDELACGAWRFIVRSEDHPDAAFEGLAEEPGVEQGGLRWALAPGATIAGTVTAIPAAERGLLEVRAIRGGEEHFFGLGAARLAPVASNGTFLLRGLEVGQSYSLQARHAQPEDELNFWERSRSNSVQARAGDSGVVLAYQPEAALNFTVLDGATRQPLERFEVDSGIDWPMPLRDEDGRQRRHFPGGVVRVGGLRPGSDSDRVQLVVRATGYRELQRADIAVRAGQELDLGPIFLEPVPVVRVRVLDQQNGKPVAGASVRLQKQLQGGAMSFNRTISVSDEAGVDAIEFGEGHTATTDEQGWATLTSFEGETADITARAKGYAPGRVQGLFLPRGEALEQELRLTLGGEVLVQVLDAEGVPLKGASVEHRANADEGAGRVLMLGAGMGAGPGQVTDAEGRVLFENLAPGLHSFRLGEQETGAMFATADTLVVHGLGGGDDSEEWSQTQVAEGERSELTLRAAPRGTLAGRVREAGKVLAGATLRLTKASAEGEERSPLFHTGGGGPEARSDGEGRYELADVKEGSYTLTVTHPTRRMPAEFPLQLRAGENSFDVDLSVAIVNGRVLDTQGKGLPGVSVWTERATSGAAPMRMRMMIVDDGGGGGGMLDTGQFGERAQTDAEGRFSLRGVSADVELVVKAEGGDVQPGQSKSLRVAPNETKDGVDVVLEAAGSIRVEARLADGSAARFQLVQATYQGQSDPPLTPKFGFLQEGSTELKGLKPGPWRVNVRSAQAGPGGGGQDRDVEVKALETANLTFEVE